MINIQVDKNNNENNVNLIKRFTKRVQGAGILPRVRSIRYSARKQSKYVVKKHALKRIANRKVIDEMIKMGKMQEKSYKR